MLAHDDDFSLLVEVARSSRQGNYAVASSLAEKLTTDHRTLGFSLAEPTGERESADSAQVQVFRTLAGGASEMVQRD